MTYRARLDRALHNAKTLPVHSESKFVLISDCHRGTGAPNDNFAKNQNLYFAAMSDYFDRGFTCIELGDGDELWENRKFQTIKETHSHVFWLLNKFYSEQRYYMIYGNHDLCKRNARFAEHHLSSYPCSTGELCPLFPGISCHEAIVLQNEETGTRFFLTHGHQADLLNSVFWKTARFLVRYLWTPLELLGIPDPTSAAKNHTRKNMVEQKLSNWAHANGLYLIAGHTHRPALTPDHLPHYCNTGSCVHPRCITCIELTDCCLTLVKWAYTTTSERFVRVTRSVLAGPVCLNN